MHAPASSPLFTLPTLTQHSPRSLQCLSPLPILRGAVHIVLELCEGGELFERIAAKGVLTEREGGHSLGDVLGYLLGYLLGGSCGGAQCDLVGVNWALQE